jgi:hypothetical protein
MIEVALLMMIPMSLFLLVIVVLGIVLIVKNKKPSSPVVDPDPEPITITDGAMYTLSKGGSYIKQDFDESRGKGKMCDAVSTSTSSEAAPFKFTKDGDFWSVATDCDGDGNYTSFLNGSSDLIAARDKDTPKRQQWTVSCESGGCSFKNRHKDRYLSGTPEKPEFVSDAALWNIT